MQKTISTSNRTFSPVRGKLRQGGFSLIITISMMVLLSLLAVGLLSLSTVTLRASTQGEAMQVARSNARLALMMAIGELQSNLGADQRISAPARFASDTAPRHMAAAWEGALATANEPDPEASSRLLGFLAAGAEDGATSPPVAEDIRLLAEGSLGNSGELEDVVFGQRIPVPTAEKGLSGAYSWVALDESVKAKADLVREEPTTLANAEHALMGAASRFGLERIEELKDYDWFGSEESGRLYSLPTSVVIPGMPNLGPAQHAVTVVSRGLLTDSARGGWKKDLSRMFDNMPADLPKSPIYDDPDAEDADNAPMWVQLQEYANTYKELVSADGGYGIEAQLPRNGGPGYNRRDRSYSLPQAPDGAMRMPIVSKVQLQFSLVSKDAHGHWGGGTIKSTTGDQQRNYMLYMIYSPIVTLYNPYNVPLSFDELRVDFKDVPIGFRFYRNNQPQTTQLAHFNQLYVYHDSNSNQPKSFGLNVRSSYTTSRARPIELAPGEAKIFGESVNGDWTWDTGGMFDWQDNLTADVPLAPGYAPGMGFWVDWLTPDHLLTGHDDGMGIMSLRATDTVDVEFAPMASQASGNKLDVEVSMVQRGRRTRAGLLQLDYSSEEILKREMAGKDTTVRYPARLQRPYRTTEIYQRPSDKIKDYARVKPFAIFSFESKTTLDSISPGKPWVQPALSSNMARIDLRNEGFGLHTHEVAMRPWRPDSAIEHDPLTNRTYAFTSNSALKGLKAAPQYEIPSMPLQSLAQLRHAGLSPQGFMGGAAYTVGESFADPLLPAEAVVGSSPKSGETLLDHAWLANNALWDGYYFSTIADHDGPAMASTRPLSQVAKDFFEDGEPLLNPRLVPSGRLEGSAAAGLAAEDEAYLENASLMMVDGPFNVNSLSVDAWKALLSSLNEETVAYYDGTGAAGGGGMAGMVDEAENPFSRMRRASGRPVEENQGGLNARHARWNGFRTLPDRQIDELAENIVEEIRERGPFLSLAEFVNRTPGSDTQAALKGALQAAIDRTDINADFDEDSKILTDADVSGAGYGFPEAMTGSNATGAPGYLTQGDLLSSLGPVMTVRSDTFRVRAYGEATDSSGRIVARAWCEAVVQRTPEYVDATDAVDELPTTEANRLFGRRFEMTGFRWLSKEEV